MYSFKKNGNPSILTQHTVFFHLMEFSLICMSTSKGQLLISGIQFILKLLWLHDCKTKPEKPKFNIMSIGKG